MTKYHANGVLIYPSAQNGYHITYTGLLQQCGAAEVYAHAGYGRQWKNTQDFKMDKTPKGFEVSIPVQKNADRLNLCFKDSANNWDNNTGANYSLLITPQNENMSLELAEEISTWDNLKTRCHTSAASCKTALCRWFGFAR